MKRANKGETPEQYQARLAAWQMVSGLDTPAPEVPVLPEPAKWPAMSDGITIRLRTWANVQPVPLMARIQLDHAVELVTCPACNGATQTGYVCPECDGAQQVWQRMEPQ